MTCQQNGNEFRNIKEQKLFTQYNKVGNFLIEMMEERMKRLLMIQFKMQSTHN